MFRKNKIKLSALISVFLFVQIFGLFFASGTVYAQTDAAITSAFTARWTYDKIESNLTAAALGSLVSGISYFMRKLAYDGAKYIASGGKGQGALVFTQSPGDYMKTVASDAAAEAIGNLGTPFGLDLCAPPDVSALTSLKVSLSKIYKNMSSFKPTPGGKSLVPDGPQAKCTWANFQKSWEQLPDMLGSDTISERFAKSLNDATQSDFGTALVALSSLDQLATDQKEAALVSRLEGQGFKAVTDLISGSVKSPASLVQEEAKGLTAKQQAQLSSSQVAGLYGSSAWPVFSSALSIFANTLVSSLLDKILNKGIVSPVEGNPLDFGATTLNNNRIAAEKAFSFLTAGIPQRSLSSYSIITQYSSCPNNPGLNNCVMDSGLVQALSRDNNPLTIKEALDPSVGLLHGDWNLVSLTDVTKNTDINCYRDAYCYSNIQKLRKARILPLGFEIAILKSNPDSPYTLQQVVDGYNDCNSNFTPDPAFPFCHLIDPNWILKVPEARCEAQVSGPLLASDNTSQRASECADFSTCLSYDSKGQCQSFGYCEQEKNVWNIPGGSCSAKDNTCKTYTGSDGSIASYLSRTLDYGTCNVESVGCMAYSADQNSDGQWKNDNNIDLTLQASGREQVLYFNNKIDNYTCPDTENGCSLFIYPATNQDVYMKKAPDYLGCYDTDITNSEINWPTTVADLTTLKDRPSQCANFAPACIPEEVGCDQYTPKDGSATLTGVVGNNFCPIQCVGYDTFKQQNTSFEQAQFPLYFIPKDGQSCSNQYAGCDEFTNLSASSGEQLEYYTELKYCQKPEGDNAKVYYAWEGSDNQGFILKKYNLWQVDEAESKLIDDIELLADEPAIELGKIGSPRYFDDSSATLSYNYNYCNATKYNNLIHSPLDVGNIASSDCRELHDTAGNIYYRLLASTVSVSDSCQPLRKTEANFYKDEDYKIQDDCLQKKGKWDDNSKSCMRCMGGGEYVADGNDVAYCKYWSIPSEAQSCPASANSCRIYIGNNGNNLHEIYSTSFEPNTNSTTTLLQAKENWGNGSVEPEATQVGLYSLKISNATTLNLSSKLNQGSWYQLSFWAHGDSSKVDIYFGNTKNNNFGSFTTDPLTGSDIPVVIGYEWQEYTLGPVMYSGDPTIVAQALLSFEKTIGDGSYFIDNVRLVSMSDDQEQYVPLIKNSWKTPEGYNVSPVCDSSPTNSYPGEFLGCKEYNTRDNNAVALTGFQNLCRAEAVGCTGLVDTHNIFPTSDTNIKKMAYNLLCVQGSSNSNSDSCNVNIDGSDYSCTLEKGQTSCHIEGPITLYTDSSVANYNSGGTIASLDTAYVDSSTVVVPFSSTTNPDLVYLAIQDDYLCHQEYLGCQEVGVQSQVLPDKTKSNSYEFSSKTILNNPANYGTTLCTQEQKSCSQFTDNKNISFFKDPLQTNGALCTYQDSKQIGGSDVKGWFMDGVGKCSNSTSTNLYCKKDSDCGTGNICNDIGNQACYPNYLSTSGEYGLYSNGSQDYNNFVGTCSASVNGCTQLVDPTDKQDYYVINDDRLFANKADCQGNVSQKDGCILFDMTEDPSKIYDSVLTYKTSKDKDYIPVPPFLVTSTVGDTNTLIKVDRDRQCGQWLSCSSSKTDVDTNGKVQELCLDYKSCNKFGLNGECAPDGWVKEDSQSTSKLTEKIYLQKNATSFGTDYSGLSLFNKYNPSDYVYLNFSGHAQDGAYLAYEMSDKYFVNIDGEDYTNLGCFAKNSGGVFTKNDGDVCGIGEGGRCYSQKCLYPISGDFSNEVLPVANNLTPAEKDVVINKNVDSMLGQLEHGTCKSYPEDTSPFDTNLSINADLNDSSVLNGFAKENANFSNLGKRLEYTSNKNAGFANANICQFTTDVGGNCSCDYIKVEYKNGAVDYWPRTTTDKIPSGVCSGSGDKDGIPCDIDSQCSTDSLVGVCNKQKQVSNNIGFKGLCLEYDLSRPLSVVKKNSNSYQDFACLTWLPIQVSASAYDLYNTSLEAGYYPTSKYDSDLGGLSYCKLAQSAAGSYDESMERDSASRDNPYLDGQNVNSNVFNVWLGKYGDNDYYYHDFTTFSNGETKDYSVFENNPEGIDIYKSDGAKYTNIVDQADNNLDTKKFAYKTFQVWGWRNLSTSARLLRLDLQSGKLSGSFWYSKPDGKGALFSFAPSYSSSADDDTGTAMHPPRLWDTNFSVPTTDVDTANYFSNTSNIIRADFSYIETSAFSPDFNATSTDNKYIYADTSVEKKINEYILDRVYFVPTYFPDGYEGNNPVTLNNQFYIDFSNLRQKLDDKKVPVESHDIPSCYGNGNTGVGDKDICRGDTSSDTTKVVTSYLLERNVILGDISQYGPDDGAGSTLGNNDCKTTGLLSYCKYSDFSSLQSRYTSASARNQIYRRYVTVFNFDSNGSLPNSNNDPFNKTCDRGDNGSSNFMVIGMDFNKDGEFLGYISRWCNNSNNDNEEGNGISFATFAQFANICTDIVSVVNDNSRQLDDYNKAWTDRVWKNAINPYVGAPYWPGNEFNLASAIAPYGSLESYVNKTSLNVANFSDLPAYIRFYSFPQGSTNVGVPYACGNSLVSGGSASGVNGINCLSSPQSDVLLSNLFQKYYTEWGPNNSGTQSDDSGTDLGTTKPPKIFAIDYLTCDNNQTGVCPAISEGLTVNNHNYPLNSADSLFVNEDKDRSGAIDPIIAQGSYTADISFYAYADDNRMPIKRVMVNWEDGSFIYDVMGDYKNRKPYCQLDSNVGRCTNNTVWKEGDSQLTCKTDKECTTVFGSNYTCDKSEQTRNHFGDQDRACISQKPFESTHTYFCDLTNTSYPKYSLSEINTNKDNMFGSLANAKEAYNKLIGKKIGETENTLKDDSQVCVFKPA
ncbi:MAG: hypothetical protein WC025_03150, partial [Candidatus Magasanikbacteria bacterium]